MQVFAYISTQTRAITSHRPFIPFFPHETLARNKSLDQLTESCLCVWVLCHCWSMSLSWRFSLPPWSKSQNLPTFQAWCNAHLSKQAPASGQHSALLWFWSEFNSGAEFTWLDAVHWIVGFQRPQAGAWEMLVMDAFSYATNLSCKNQSTKDSTGRILSTLIIFLTVTANISLMDFIS